MPDSDVGVDTKLRASASAHPSLSQHIPILSSMTIKTMKCKRPNSKSACSSQGKGKRMRFCVCVCVWEREREREREREKRTWFLIP